MPRIAFTRALGPVDLNGFPIVGIELLGLTADGVRVRAVRGCGAEFSWPASQDEPPFCNWCRQQMREARRVGRDERRSALAAAEPHITACRSATNAAIAHGLLRKPLECDRCDATKIVAHHRDYRDPLLIDWLCRRCHTREHRALRLIDCDPVTLFAWHVLEIEQCARAAAGEPVFVEWAREEGDLADVLVLEAA